MLVLGVPTERDGSVHIKIRQNVENIYVYREICTILQISNFNTKKKLRTHHFIETKKLQKYLCGLLSIVIDEADLQNITNQLINDISNFNNKRMIHCYRKN